MKLQPFKSQLQPGSLHRTMFITPSVRKLEKCIGCDLLRNVGWNMVNVSTPREFHAHVVIHWN
jgi:hypothetical protein